MTIKFYSITAKRNVLNKTLGTSTDLTGTLRDPCSLIDPDVLIESATVPAFNYAYIQDFGRYYFVTSIVAEQYNLFRVRMHVDVLMSFKTGILNQPAIIARQEKYWNLFINDGQFKVYQNSIIGKIPFPSGFSAQTPCYTLAVAGTACGGGGGGGAE